MAAIGMGEHDTALGSAPGCPALRAASEPVGSRGAGDRARAGRAPRLGRHAMGARYSPGQRLAISLAAARLPEYALRSVLRMGWALLFSLAFSLAYGALAAKSRRAARILIP